MLELDIDGIIWCEEVEWIKLAQDKFLSRARTKMAIDFIKVAEFGPVEERLFSKGETA